MNKSKILAYIFIPIGAFISILGNFYTDKIIESVFGDLNIPKNDNSISLIISIIIIVFLTTIALINVTRNRKHTGIGILLLLFVNIITGVFYFIWKPDPEVNGNKTVSSVSWTCPDCGKTNYYNNVCSCGHKKDSYDYKNDYENNNKICPQCKHKNTSDAIYCSNCGKKL